MGTAGLVRRDVAADVNENVATAKALLAEVEAGGTRAGLEEDLVGAVAAIAAAGDARRAEIIAEARVRDEAAKRWQIIVDAHEVLSDQERKAAVDRKASAEALGDALGTVGGMAFAGLGEVAKFGVDVLFGTGGDGDGPTPAPNATAPAPGGAAAAEDGRPRGT